MNDDPGESFVIRTLLNNRPPMSDQIPLVDAGDDAVVLADGTAVSVDTMVHGVHWDDRSSAEDVGWKAIATAASDIGAMGGQPTWAVVALSIPPSTDKGWITRLADGMHQALARWQIRLVGGDTTKTHGPITISVTVGGPSPHPVLRSGGAAGDHIWVTGALGRASVGFAHGGPCLQWLQRPEPPIEFGHALGQQQLPTAMMDLSDGLAQDLSRLCQASQVGALVDSDRLPSTKEVDSASDRLSHQVAFGEDYELLFCAHPDSEQAVQELAKEHKIRVTCIGSLTDDMKMSLKGHNWPPSRFTHFGTETDDQQTLSRTPLRATESTSFPHTQEHPV